MWDMDVEECAELGHDYKEYSEWDIIADAMTYVQVCTWCGEELED